jgi:hypothetical protein
MVDDARLAFRTGLLVAESAAAPQWLSGDEFAPLRPPGAPVDPTAQ